MTTIAEHKAGLRAAERAIMAALEAGPLGRAELLPLAGLSKKSLDSMLSRLTENNRIRVVCMYPRRYALPSTPIAPELPPNARRVRMEDHGHRHGYQPAINPWRGSTAGSLAHG